MRTMLLITALMLTIPAAAAAQGGQAGSETAVDQRNSRVVEEELQLDRAARREIQEGLEAAGFDPGGVDGLFGPRTRAAIRAWQSAQGSRATGYLDEASAADERPLPAAETPPSTAGAPAGQQATSPDPPPAPASAEQETVFWQSVMDSSNPAELEAYLAQFPNGVFRALAEARLAALRSPPTAPSTAAPEPPADDARPRPAAAAPAEAAEETERIERAVGALDAVMDADDSAIPTGILERAQGIAVFPGTTRAGFGFGGMRGRGILSARSDGSWSAPAFLTLTGGSFGLQIGVQRSDIVLVIMGPEGLDNLVSNQFSIGVDAGVAAGPVGRNAAAATDIQLSAQILSYSRARGVFAGVTINGSTIRQDVDANERFYGARLDTRRIVFEDADEPYEPVGLWRQALARYAN